MPEQNKKNFYCKGGVSRFAGVMLLPLLLGACSSTPDWANPIEWFSSDNPEPPTKVTSAENVVPAEGFPNLSSVPGESPQTTPGNLRDQVAEGLIADRNNAEYSNQPLTARSTLVPPAPPPSVPQAPVTASSAAPESPAVTQSELPAASPQVASAPQPSQQTTVISSQGAVLPPAFPNGAPSYAQPQYSGPAFNTPSWGSPYAQQGGYAQQSSGYSSTGGTGGQLVAVIYFAHGSSRLNQQDMQVIRDVASLYGQRGGQITVLGHSSSRTQLTDALTHQQVNMEISSSRAQSVTQALVESGVSSSQVITDARSDTNPVFHEFMPTGEAGNRRVEIYVN